MWRQLKPPCLMYMMMYTVKEVVDTEDFARLVGNLPELVKNFSKLNNKVTQLPDKKFSKGKKGFNFL